MLKESTFSKLLQYWRSLESRRPSYARIAGKGRDIPFGFKLLEYLIVAVFLCVGTDAALARMTKSLGYSSGQGGRMLTFGSAFEFQSDEDASEYDFPFFVERGFSE